MGELQDDRGRDVTKVARVGQLVRGLGWREQARFYKRQRESTPEWALAIRHGTQVFLYMPITFLVVDRFWGHKLGLVVGMLLVAGGILVYLAAWSVTRHAVRKGVIAGARAVERCACCAYVLSEIEAADEGCAVCPECGAAWRVASV